VGEGALGELLRGMTLPCGAAGCLRMSDITLEPCGHKSLCRNCCLQRSECPLCHKTIERRVHKRSGKSERWVNEKKDERVMCVCVSVNSLKRLVHSWRGFGLVVRAADWHASLAGSNPWQ
jgi:hypothetical protein